MAKGPAVSSATYELYPVAAGGAKGVQNALEPSLRQGAGAAASKAGQEAGRKFSDATSKQAATALAKQFASTWAAVGRGAAAAVATIGRTVAGGFRAAFSGIGAIVSNVGSAFASLGSRLSASVGGFSNLFHQAFDSLKVAAASAVESVASVLARLTSRAAPVWDAISGKVREVASSIGSVLSPAISRVASGFQAFGANVAGVISRAGSAVGSFGASIAQKLTIPSWVSTAWSKLGSAASTAFAGIRSGAETVVSAVGSAFSRAASVGDKALSSLGRSGSNAWNSIKTSASSTATSVGSSMSKAGSAMTNTLGGAATIADGLVATSMAAIASHITGAAERADTLEKFPTVMSNMGYSASEAEVQIGRIKDSLDGLPASTDEVARSVMALSPVVGDMGQATDIALSLSDALAAGGASASLSANALEQYRQMMAAGTVDMMAWRSMTNAMPLQMDAIAKSILGASANSMELYDAMKAGTVSFDEFNAALVKLDSEGVAGMADFHTQAQNMSAGIITAVVNAGNRINNFLATIMQAIGVKSISGAINDLTAGLSGLGKEIGNYLAPLAKSGELWTMLAGAIAAVSAPVALAKSGITAFAGVASRLKPVIGFLAKHMPIFGRALGALGKLSGIGTFISMVVASEKLRDALSQLWDVLSGSGGNQRLEALTRIMGECARIAGDILAGAITTILIPGLEVLADMLNTVTGWFDGLQEAAANGNGLAAFAVKVVEVGGALLMLQGIGVPLATAFDLVKDAVNGLGVAFKFLMKNPVVLVLVGIVAAIMAVVYAIRNWDEVREWCSKAWTWVTEALGNIWNSITSWFASVDWGGLISTAWNAIVGFLGTVIGGIGTFLAWLWDTIWNWVTTTDWGGIVSSAWNAIYGWVTSIDWWGLLTGIWDAVWGWVMSVDWAAIPGNIWDAVYGFFSGIDWGALWSGIWDALTAFVSNIVTWIGDNWQTVLKVLAALFIGLPLVIIALLLAGLALIAAALLAAIIGLLVGLGEMISSALGGLLSILMGIWNGIWTWLSGVWGSFISWVGEVWNNVTTAIGNAFSGAWNAIVSVWNNIWAFLSNLWSNIASFASTVWNGIANFFKNTWNNIKSFASNTWNFIKNAFSTTWNAVKAQASNIWNGIKSLFTNTWNSIKSFASNIWNTLKNAFSTTWNAIKSQASNIWNGMKNLFSNTMNGLKNAASNAWNNIKSAFSNGVNNAINFVKQLPSKAKSALGNVGHVLLDAGKNLIKGFINGIKNMFSSVKNTLGNLTSKLTSWKGPEDLDKVLLIPSGQFIIEGFIVGLESMYDEVQDSLGGLTAEIPAMVDMAPANLDAMSLGAINGQGGSISGGQVTIIQNNPREKSDSDIRADVADGLRLAAML